MAYVLGPAAVHANSVSGVCVEAVVLPELLELQRCRVQLLLH